MVGFVRRTATAGSSTVDFTSPLICTQRAEPDDIVVGSAIADIGPARRGEQFEAVASEQAEELSRPARSRSLDLTRKASRSHDWLHAIDVPTDAGIQDVFRLVADLDALPPAAPRIFLSTGKLVGVGFDHPPLDTLVLAMPVSWRGTLQQYAGRLHREHASKTDVRIIDFVDAGHPALLRMWDKRQRGYRAMGYRVGSEDATGDLEV